jgi:hypothetical protein
LNNINFIASTFLIKEVSGLFQGHVIIVPNAALYCAGHIWVSYFLILEFLQFKPRTEKTIMLVALGCENIKISLMRSSNRSLTLPVWNMGEYNVTKVYKGYRLILITKELDTKNLYKCTKDSGQITAQKKKNLGCELWKILKRILHESFYF